MTNSGQFGGGNPKVSQPDPVDCAYIELWLTEWTEGTLPASLQQEMEDHARHCSACKERMTLARTGREWLHLLHEELLEPPADLVSKILAKTSHPELLNHPHPQTREWQDKTTSTQQVESLSSAILHPTWQRNPVILMRRAIFEPRAAMVAAMAFFSITLTLNLLGIRLNHLHPADLSPNNVRRSITRQYADVDARMARYYENLRIVYEVEARVQQFHPSADANPSPRPRKLHNQSRKLLPPTFPPREKGYDTVTYSLSKQPSSGAIQQPAFAFSERWPDSSIQSAGRPRNGIAAIMSSNNAILSLKELNFTVERRLL